MLGKVLLSVILLTVGSGVAGYGPVGSLKGETKDLITDVARQAVRYKAGQLANTAKTYSAAEIDEPLLTAAKETKDASIDGGVVVVTLRAPYVETVCVQVTTELDIIDIDCSTREPLQ